MRNKRDNRRRIGLLTGGGDCPGINAVIRAVVKTAVSKYGMEVTGFLDGFHGLVCDRAIRLRYDDVSNILTRGGTILGMSRRESFFRLPSGGMKVPGGRDRTRDALRIVRKHRLQGIVCIGGEGTLAVASHLNASGIPTIGVPKTIDNDVPNTDQTFGFDSALNVAASAVDNLHSTASSHHRIMVLEVMGRYTGWLALHAGVAGGGDVILIPEIPFSWRKIEETVIRRARRGRRFSIIVAAEGAHPGDGRAVYAIKAGAGRRGTLGGISTLIAETLEAKTGLECRATILGYLQRGGAPSPFDRILATRYGHAAACLAAAGNFGLMVSLDSGSIRPVPIEKAAEGPKTVPPDHPLLAAARAVGTSFGD